jgi:uncharacterized protein YjbJ (UPF0337 family)
LAPFNNSWRDENPGSGQSVLCVCQVTLSARVHLRFASRAAAAKDFSLNDRDLVELQPHAGVVIGLSKAGRHRLNPLTTRRHPMNWDQIQLNWMQFKNNVRTNWVKLTDEDLTRIGGRREELAKRLQARYGFAKAEADREIEAWTKTQRYAA